MSSLNRVEYNAIIEALSARKSDLVEEIKTTVKREQASRHVADLAVTLRQVEQTETYFLQLGMPSRSVFSPVATTRSVGTPDDVERGLVTPVEG